MSIISAGTSNTTSIIYTGDTTGNLAFQTNGTTEAMRITSGGNIGIGTASPRWDLPFASNAGRLVDCNSVTANTPSVLAITSVGTDITARAIISFQNLSQTSGSARMVQIQAERTTASTTALDADFVVNVSKTGTLTERMRIDSSGRVTTPSQPAFLASNSTLAYTGTTSSSPFAFNNTTINVGSGFNTSTYRFTAPIAGRYLLYFSLFFDTGIGTTNCDVLFCVNGAQLSGGTAALLCSRPNQDRITLGNTLVLDLNASDYVDVRGRDATGTGNAIYGPHSYFGGYLVG